MLRSLTRQWLPVLARLTLALSLLAVALFGAWSAPVVVVEAAPRGDYAGPIGSGTTFVPVSISSMGYASETIANQIKAVRFRATSVTLRGGFSLADISFALRDCNDDSQCTGGTSRAWGGTGQFENSGAVLRSLNTWYCLDNHAVRGTDCQAIFGAGNYTLVTNQNIPHAASSGAVRVGFQCQGCDPWAYQYQLGFAGTATATPTNTPTSTNTPTPTPTSTSTPTPTPTIASGPQAFPSSNHLINTDFNIAPGQFAAGWTDIGRVIQAPLQASLSRPPIEGMHYGSCGDNYWVMSSGASEPGSIWQDFSWNGGQMFISLEGLTESYQTYAQVSVMNKGTGEIVPLPPFTNGSFNWLSFKWVTQNQPAGQYRFAVDYESVASRPAIAIDNVEVRRGFWGTDCPSSSYRGTIPTIRQGTATAEASVTAAAFGPGVNRLNNCGFEQGWVGWGHNNASRLFYTGGAVGPTYAYLYTNNFQIEPDPIGEVSGRIYQPFRWDGGQMYVSYFTQGGTRASTYVQSLDTGATYQMQSAEFGQAVSGWIKRSYSFSVPQAGRYIIQASSPFGQIAALDGFTVASGTWATGSCSNANSEADNNATATAHATQTQIAATAGPNLTQTADANEGPLNEAYLTHVASYRQTSTAIAAATQTQAPPATQTQAAALTATQAARQTATAQGTAVPTVTRTPMPTQTFCELHPLVWICLEDPPVTVVFSPAELTAAAVEMQATQTAQAAIVLTLFAQAQGTATARAQQTQSAAQTQTAAPIVAATQQAALQQTATARAQQTATGQALANSNATATAQAQATQAQAQVQATQTAAAVQTELAAAPDATAEAAATSTAQAFATAAAQVTATAQAASTQAALATSQAASNLPPVDERPEPAPGVDCIRPSSPLQVANWIDYEVCRVLTWFSWTPDNTAQIALLEQSCADRYPCGLMLELQETFDVFTAWAQSIPCVGGFCDDQSLTTFNISARGILLGEFDWSDTGPSYSTECDLLLAPIVGPAIQTGACFCLNVLCALGILPWAQLIWNVVMAYLLALYVQRTWFSAAHT